MRTKGLLVVAIAAAISSLPACSRVYVAPPGSIESPAATSPLSVVYLVGDFGMPKDSFVELTDAIGRNVEGDEALPLRSAPIILELGDNLYEQGLPHDLSTPGAQEEIDKLRAIAAEFAEIRYRGDQVSLVLVPGNHDYQDNALVQEEFGDISRWYFLEELGVEGAEHWDHEPGDAAGFESAAALSAHIDGNPRAHTDFMKPVLIAGTGDDVFIVALDSELVLDLYAEGLDDLADAYLDRLAEALDALPAGGWKLIATHHPPVTYGKHGRPSFGNWLFGQGWPQFPKTWQWGLAAAVPLGVGLAIVAAPAVSTAMLSRRKQDVGSEPYRRYADKLLEIAHNHSVAVILAGHDHNTQLIDLGSANVGAASGLLVVTGAGSRVDSVSKGPGLLAYVADYSYVRMVQYVSWLSFEVKGRHGELLYRYDLPR